MGFLYVFIKAKTKSRWLWRKIYTLWEIRPLYSNSICLFIILKMPCPLSFLLCRTDLRAILTSSGKKYIEKEEVNSNFRFALRLSSLKHLKKYFLVCPQIPVSLSPTRMSPCGRSQTGVPVLAIPRGAVCGCWQRRPQEGAGFPTRPLLVVPYYSSDC